MAPRPAWLESAIRLQAAGRIAEAERIYGEVLKSNPGQPDALNLLGLIAAQRGRFDMAATLIERAIALAPGRGDFHAALGNVSLAREKQDDMTRCYRRALALIPLRSVPASFTELAQHAGAAAKAGVPEECDSYRSQFFQDIYLDRFVFGGMRGGVFVDIGAHDGITLSNSVFFEQVRGWSGLCIEPNPSAYERLRASRRSICLDCCIAGQEGTVAFRRLSGFSEMLSGIAGRYHPDHAARIAEEQQKFGGTSETLTLRARTLAGIADEHGLQEIHYLSVDTEGSEFDILCSVPETKPFVHAVTAECNYEEERPRLIAAMRDKGFDMVMALSHDLLFLNRRSFGHSFHAKSVTD